MNTLGSGSPDNVSCQISKLSSAAGVPVSDELSIRRNTLKTNADLECRTRVLSWLSIRDNSFKTNADLECRAGVLSWLSITLNACKTNADLQCRA
ncbi:hypothetical protein DPMN_069988 [Dreissena polymorpha]|uniref:Uncharacterized protein n=1 Tax=Dreissena polymorpha TaxID=45954 RepID=A0A9D3Z5C8_DREPO|nr:hypothetical protein DPMN_069988 [Dreissena polymorpha]